MKTGSALVEDIEKALPKPGEILFWWLGQMGFAVKGANRVLYIDTFFSDVDARLYPPILTVAQAANADFILGTHDHADHIDRESWIEIARISNAKFVVPNYHLPLLPQQLRIPEDRFIGVSDDRETILDTNITVRGVASSHEFLDYDPVRREYPYMGYLLTIDGVVLYHPGDTCRYEGMETRLKRIPEIHAMFLPINGRDAERYLNDCIGNMTYQEAVDLAGGVGPGVVVPCHYDMFRGNTENPELFVAYLKAKYPKQAFWVCDYGAAKCITRS